jgi:hypothetical protein
MARRLTREILEAHLHCRYKSHLNWAGARAELSDYEVMSAGLSADVRQQAIDWIVTRQPGTAVVREVLLTTTVLKAGPAFVLDAVMEDDSFSMRFDGLMRVPGPSPQCSMVALNPRGNRVMAPCWRFKMAWGGLACWPGPPEAILCDLAG